MPRFDESFIERVREASDIVQVLSPFVTFKNAGNQLTGLCPFPDHREKTPSFSVSPTKQAFYCFGCKRGGNVFTFLQQVRGMSFPEAVEFLADRAGIPLPENKFDHSSDARLARDEKQVLFKINRIAATHFHHNLKSLKSDHTCRRYLEKRGLAWETVEAFGLGYAPESWDDLVREFQRRNIPIQLVEQLGLIKKRTGGATGTYDVFRNRLIFPIVTVTSEVVGFGGRVLDDAQPKYLNSPESPIFSKGKTFYGFHESSKYARAEDELIVVEGYMDFLGLFQTDIKNVVATLGTALTEDHARVLARTAKSVVLLFDGDAAGLEATERSLPILLSVGLAPKVVQLPPGQDPDEFVRSQGAKALKSLVRDSGDLFLTLLARWMRDFRAIPAEQFALAEKLAPILVRVKEPALAALYLQESAGRMRVEGSWLNGIIARKEGAPKNLPQQSSSQFKLSSSAGVSLVREASNRSHSELPKEEVWLLNLALYSKELLDQIVHAEVIPLFTSELVRKLLVKAVDVSRQHPDKFDSLPSILATTDQGEVDSVASSLVTQFLDRHWLEGRVGNGFLSTDADVNAPKVALEKGRMLTRDCIKKVKDRHLRARAKDLATQLRNEKSPEAIKDFLEAVKTRHSLSK